MGERAQNSNTHTLCSGLYSSTRINTIISATVAPAPQHGSIGQTTVSIPFCFFFFLYIKWHAKHTRVKRRGVCGHSRKGNHSRKYTTQNKIVVCSLLLCLFVCLFGTRCVCTCAHCKFLANAYNVGPYIFGVVECYAFLIYLTSPFGSLLMSADENCLQAAMAYDTVFYLLLVQKVKSSAAHELWAASVLWIQCGRAEHLLSWHSGHLKGNLEEFFIFIDAFGICFSWSWAFPRGNQKPFVLNLIFIWLDWIR